MKLATQVTIRPSVRATGAALLALLLVPSAWAQDEQPQRGAVDSSQTGVLYACYVPPTGLVYRIKGPDLPQACLSEDHVEFSWVDASARGVQEPMVAAAPPPGGGGGGGGNVQSLNDLTGALELKTVGGATITTDDVSEITISAGDGHSLDAADGNPVDAVVVDNEGNVGIGSPTPGAKLDVAGDIQARRIALGDFGGVVGTIHIDGIANTITTGTDDDLAILPGGSGKVGIGTGMPSELLTVDGTIESTTGGFKFPDGTIMTTAGRGDGHSLDAADGDPVDALVVDNGGNVGIGTTNPGAPLEVIRNTLNPAEPQIILNNTGDGGLQNVIEFQFGGYPRHRIRAANGGALFLSTLTNNHIRFRTNDVNRMQISGNGNVGIGTIDPGERLTVAGTIESTSGGFKFPDGSIQTSAASEAEVPDGHSLDAADGDPVDVVKVSVNGNVSVSGPITLHDAGLAIAKGLDPPELIFHVSGVTGDVMTKGNITAEGEGSFAEDIVVGGDATVGGNATVSGDATVSGTIASAGGGFMFPDGSVQTTAAVTGWEKVFETEYADGTFAQLQLRANCTFGKNVLGGGFTYYDGDVKVSESRPSLMDDAWVVGFEDPDDGTTMWVYAICAYVGE
jgi:hypothetical protein